MTRLAPAWLISGAVHLVLLFLFFHVALAGPADGSLIHIDVVRTDVEPEEQRENLFETEVSLEAPGPAGGIPDRIEEVPVPRVPVDPTGQPGALANMETPVVPPWGAGASGADGVRDWQGYNANVGLGTGIGDLLYRPTSTRPSGAGRNEALKHLGGNTHAEDAVARGLEWLALHQATDGRWSLHEFHRHAREKPLPAGKTFTDNCTGQAIRQNDIAGTAFGLLPFLAGGLTHKAGKAGQSNKYLKTVEGALKFLISKQGKDGYFGGDMYSHGLASIAMCEAYGMTSDPIVKQSAQRAVNFIVEAQDPAGGGWRYAPKMAGDLSVTGWQLMALKSGQMAGLAVPAASLKKAEKFVDSCEATKKGGFSYTPGSPESNVMTAVGLLCRQYMGVNPRNPGLLAGAERIKKVPPGGGNLYYEYYATQVLFHMGGDSWNFWNLGPNGTGKGGIRDMLIRKQDYGADPKRPSQRGSWDPVGTGFEKEGGRIMATSLSLLTLEVYYRHLPLYRRDLGATKEGR